MESSSDLSALSERLTKQFPSLGGPVTAREPVQGGFLCKNYAVTVESGTRYFLKYYRMEMSQFVGVVKDAEKLFAKAGIPVILPLQGPDDGTMFHIDDQNGVPVWASLYPFVKAPMPAPDPPDVTIASIASTLARMHVAGEGKGSQANRLRFDVNTTQMFAETKRAVDAAKNLPRSRRAKRLRALLNRKLEFIKRMHEICADINLDSGTLLHGDFQGQNTFVDDEGRVSHVYDFEHAAAGDPAFEMVRCLNLSCFETGFNERTFRRGAIFLAAYREARPLTSEDLLRGMRAYLWHTAHKVRIESDYLFKENVRVLRQLGPMEARFKYFAKGDKKIREFCSRLEKTS